ncbi:hypothetical protein GCM10008959_32690 [Deinococcus seoulensis]|uniref:ParB N-terminal domain-containing protein n=1 Tax=Deinococcus seoulensis TaxID=1837379 RepID=A0ABQ2RX15_9DEIO|nr:hypothetical protein [Deinococcus seoulensis]GGR68073.1 hypothetical protein GCM10008959_32690 [Deinococcus seoulensis]
MSKKPQAPAAASTLRIEYLPLADLTRWPGNPKEHADGAIAASISRFGFRDPLAIDETTGRLIAGHGRLSVLERAHAAGQPAPQFVQVRDDGMWLIPVTRGGSFADESEASAYLIAHNRTSELGGWNEDLLAGMLGSLDDSLRAVAGFDLDAFVQETTAAAAAVTLPPAPPSEFLNDLITPPMTAAPAGLPQVQTPGPQAADPGATAATPSAPVPATAAPTITTPPPPGGEEYVQLVVVLPVSERNEALAVLKDVRAKTGLETTPAAFMTLIRQYAQANGVSA